MCILVDSINLREEKNEDQIKKRVKNVLTHNLVFNEEKVKHKFDKFHPVRLVKYGQQTTKVHFKSHKLKEVVYKKTPNKQTNKQTNKKKTKTTKNKKIKIKLSLARTPIKTLNYAHEVTNENPEIINFVFADPYGNLKLR